MNSQNMVSAFLTLYAVIFAVYATFFSLIAWGFWYLVGPFGFCMSFRAWQLCL